MIAITPFVYIIDQSTIITVLTHLCVPHTKKQARLSPTPVGTPRVFDSSSSPLSRSLVFLLISFSLKLSIYFNWLSYRLVPSRGMNARSHHELNMLGTGMPVSVSSLYEFLSRIVTLYGRDHLGSSFLSVLKV